MDDAAELRRNLRDLVALTALPAIWLGQSPQVIVESFTDALLRTLRVDFLYARLPAAAESGSLIEAVNLLGSLFYGSLLGVFMLAFWFRRVTGTGAFLGMLAGEAAIFWAFWFTGISFLWYNVIGCVVVVVTGVLVSYVSPGRPKAV